MKMHINDWDTSVDKMIMANGNDLFIKNVDKVRRTFYKMSESITDKAIVIKGKLIQTFLSSQIIHNIFKFLNREKEERTS